MENALDALGKIQDDLQNLEKYFTSSKWKKDYDIIRINRFANK